MKTYLKMEAAVTDMLAKGWSVLGYGPSGAYTVVGREADWKVIYHDGLILDVEQGGAVICS